MEESYSNRKLVIAVFATAILLVGCASLPPTTPINDIGSIAGAWRSKSGGTLVIQPDGTYKNHHSRRAVQVITGAVTLKDGKAVASRGPDFTLTLLDREGKQVLLMSSGELKAEFARVK